MHDHRAATSAEDAFILGFVERFGEVALPPGRERDRVNAGIRRGSNHACASARSPRISS